MVTDPMEALRNIYRRTVDWNADPLADPVDALDYILKVAAAAIEHAPHPVDETLRLKLAEARVGVLREALAWIVARADAAVTGHRAALGSCADRARAALESVRLTERP